jgi:CheY-like chemotaxis protein
MFPLLKIEPRTLFVDDDEAIIEVFSNVMPARFRGHFCNRTVEVDSALGNAAELFEREQTLLMAMDPSREGSPLDCALEYLRWIRSTPVFSVLVSDHVMPEESGVELCLRHRYHGLRRILLTGVADSDLAVKAFNRGAIEQFIPKQTPRLFESVVSIIDEHHQISSADRGSCLLAFLSLRSREILNAPGVAAGLDGLLKEQAVVDYVAVASPLGVMGTRRDGSGVWIQIEEETSLPLLQSMAHEVGWNEPQVNLICSHQLLPNVDLVAQVDGVAPAFAKGVEISKGILAGVFLLPRGVL